MIEYKGYIGAVNFDPEIDLFHLHIQREQNPMVLIECKRWDQPIARNEGQICFYYIPDDMEELLPVLKCAYNKHRRK